MKAKKTMGVKLGPITYICTKIKYFDLRNTFLFTVFSYMF